MADDARTDPDATDGLQAVPAVSSDEPAPSLGRLIARTALVADAAAHQRVNAELKDARSDAGAAPTIVGPTDGDAADVGRTPRPQARRRWLWPFA